MQTLENTTLDTWCYVHAINLDGVFLECKYKMKLMKEHGGSVINISSRSGLVVILRDIAYSYSKTAVRYHTKSITIYYAEQGYYIRCNAVNPAVILTPMWNDMLK